MRPLDVTSRNLRGHSTYYVTFYSNYSGRGVAPGCFLYGQVRYGIGLGDGAMRNAISESITNG